ncbi:hypothetical protein HDU84_006683 [Entophlyctis sp. JEL0112]|nr:hypothetical protein HDU84_006683 [Entophlyctis sp. JEL0112]
MVPLGLFLGGEFRVAKKYFLASGALVAIFAAWAFSVEEFGVRTFERYVSAVDELVYTLWIDLLKLQSSWIHPALVLCALSFAWLSVAVVSGYRRWDIVILILSICLGQLLLIPQCSSLIIPEFCSGLGIGIASATLHNSYPNARIDVVELDPNVLGFAVEYFGFPNVTGKTNLVAADGRAFLEHSESGKYDYVLHDVFTNGGVGGRLISFEALSQSPVLVFTVMVAQKLKFFETNNI